MLHPNCIFSIDNNYDNQSSIDCNPAFYRIWSIDWNELLYWYNRRIHLYIPYTVLTEKQYYN